MGPFTTFKLIRKMTITILHWRRLTKLHWLLVDIQISIRLKHLIFRPTLGLKLQIILIILSKFPFFSKVFSFSKVVRDLLTFNYSIYEYASVTTGQGALIIGGNGGGTEVATVACYNNAGWNKLDDLQSTRKNHRAIINGDEVYIVGGRETR